LKTEPFQCGSFCAAYTGACAAALKLPADYCSTHTAAPDAYYCYPYAADVDFVVSHSEKNNYLHSVRKNSFELSVYTALCVSFKEAAYAFVVCCVEESTVTVHAAGVASSNINCGMLCSLQLLQLMLLLYCLLL
jgi:hypothetical protein